MVTVRSAFCSLVTLLGTGLAAADDAPRFERDVLPIFRGHCLKCHGAVQRKGGLSLRTPAAMLEGGDTGPALVKGSVDESLLIEQVESGAMPPGKAKKLTESEIATLKAWVAAGSPSDATSDPAEDEPVHWSFRPPVRPE